jgi:hypothetical protein
MPDAIDDQRQNSIKSMIEGLHNLLTELRDGKRGCSFACGSMLLGSLMKSMHSNNLLSDLSLRPQIPFPGLSFEGTATGIRLIQSPPWDERLGDHGSSLGTAFGNSGPFRNMNASGSGNTFLLPFGGSSFQDVSAFGSNNHGSRWHECNLQDLVKPILDRVGLTMTGLKLELYSGST